MNDVPKLGATGEFPDGKLNEEDEGQLQLAVGVRNGQVFMAFGKPVSWMAMPPGEARKFAAMLNEKADAAEKKEEGGG